MSNQQGTETTFCLYSSSQFVLNLLLSHDFLATSSTAFPTSLPLSLKVIEFIVGMFMQDIKKILYDFAQYQHEGNQELLVY